MKGHLIKAVSLTGFFVILVVPVCFAASFNNKTLNEMNNYGKPYTVIALEQPSKAANELPVRKINNGDNGSQSSLGNDEKDNIDPSRDTVR